MLMVQMHRIAWSVVTLLGLGAALYAQPIPGYRTVDEAVTTTLKKTATTVASSPGYLGIATAVEAGRLVVADVEENSPAAKAGLKTGDIVRQVDGKAIANAEALRGLLQRRGDGENIRLTISRGKETFDIEPKLIPTSKVLQVGTQRAILGVQIEATPDSKGVTLRAVTPKSAADRAGLKAGDSVLKLDGRNLGGAAGIADALESRKPGDVVTLYVKSVGEDKGRDVKVTLAGDAPTIPGKGPKGGKIIGGAPESWDSRNLITFKRDAYRLAIVCIEYSDVKGNAKIAAKNWEEALFSTKSYLTTSVTGQKVHGSMNDYYQEQSFGKLKVEGKCFPFVTVTKKRADYAAANTGAGKTALLGEAFDKLFARDGKDCLNGFDGVFFLYAGERVQTNRGGIYWPHRSRFIHQGKTWNYFIVQEGGDKMCDISVICHEFGHLLGLPDLYARPENPGSEGAGVWCAMSNQAPGGKPQHFSAWSKEQLSWIRPAIIDPTVKQKLILAPIEDSPKECFKVLVRLDGSEYFLLENRRKKGFDHSLPAEGLLIWRVIANRPILEESHGIEGPVGPRVFLDSVPFPTASNRAFTPFTTPTSRSQLGGGMPVHITNIRRQSDGRITFMIGYEFY